MKQPCIDFFTKRHLTSHDLLGKISSIYKTQIFIDECILIDILNAKSCIKNTQFKISPSVKSYDKKTSENC